MSALQLLGYGLHLASCALHRAAARSLKPPAFSAQPPCMWMARSCKRWSGRGTVCDEPTRFLGYCPMCRGSGEGDATDIELADVSPLAARVVGAIARRCGHG